MSPKSLFPDTQETLTNLEQVSIRSLVAYTAYDKNISEDAVLDVFAKHFGVNCIEKLPRNAFDDAVRFLVDIKLD